MNTNPNTIEEMESKIRWYTDHQGKPTTDEFYASQGIGLHELSQDWSEIFNNTDCMRGYRKGRADAEVEEPWPENRKPNQLLAEISLKYIINDYGLETITADGIIIDDFCGEEGHLIIRALTEAVGRHIAKVKARALQELEDRTDATKAR
jgi:hypothetical protein